MYVYKRTEPGLWTVGYYDPEGRWEPESDHDTTDKAADRVAYLNGGVSASEVAKAILDEPVKEHLLLSDAQIRERNRRASEETVGYRP